MKEILKDFGAGLLFFLLTPPLLVCIPFILVVYLGSIFRNSRTFSESGFVD